MKLQTVRIKNFRTVGGNEVDLDLAKSLTLVGANNSGKTNMLRAIEMLFTGHENSLGYSRLSDLTFGAGSAKTSLLATFRGEFEREIADSGQRTYSGEDAQFFEDFDKLCTLYGRDARDDTFTLSLVFSPSDTPVYQFFPNLRKPRDNASQASISRTQRQLVTDLLSKFSCHYIPSAKSMEQLYEEIINPFLIKAAAKAVEPQVSALKSALSAVAEGINEEFVASGLGHLQASFSWPGSSVEELLTRFQFDLSDPHKTSVNRKGQGIQSTALLAALRWVTAAEAAEGRQSIWLLEEPESYLHPELMGTVRKLLGRLVEESTVVVSTHALAFVPSDVNCISGVTLDGEGFTAVEGFKTAVEAGSRLRSALGVKFSDYYSLGAFNVAVEGPSDRELIEWYLNNTDPEMMPLENLRNAHLIDFGGVKFLSGWMRATYEHIQKECCLVALLDGDPAGERERLALTQYFGNRGVSFQANRNYVVVRAGFPIEAAFPDVWLLDANEENPSWFSDMAVDASHELQAFSMVDSKKSSIMKYLIGKAEASETREWATRLDKVMNALNDGLGQQARTLERKGGAYVEVAMP